MKFDSELPKNKFQEIPEDFFDINMSNLVEGFTKWSKEIHTLADALCKTDANVGLQKEKLRNMKAKIYNDKKNISVVNPKTGKAYTKDDIDNVQDLDLDIMEAREKLATMIAEHDRFKNHYNALYKTIEIIKQLGNLLERDYKAWRDKI